MGLLEKAQYKKQTLKKTEDATESDILKEKKAEMQLKPSGLLEKAKEKRQKIVSVKTVGKKESKVIKYDVQKKIYTVAKGKEKGGKEVIEKRTGFGWNGLGTRKIVFDNDINEYIYELSEPVLNEDEQDIKDELSHLFKMLADVNITNMNKEEKEKYLEETLEQIIIDNNIKFGLKKKWPVYG